jgi:hypothetical protein
MLLLIPPIVPHLLIIQCYTVPILTASLNNNIKNKINVLAELLELLLCIQEVLLSNLSPETDNPDWSVSLK